PRADHAGRLIEAAGLKGLRVGRARISQRHANFIVNEGGARADDVKTLMNVAQRAVWERSGVWLEPEGRLVGSWEIRPSAFANGVAPASFRRGRRERGVSRCAWRRSAWRWRYGRRSATLLGPIRTSPCRRWRSGTTAGCRPRTSGRPRVSSRARASGTSG